MNLRDRQILLKVYKELQGESVQKLKLQELMQLPPLHFQAPLAAVQMVHDHQMVPAT